MIIKFRAALFLLHIFSLVILISSIPPVVHGQIEFSDDTKIPEQFKPDNTKKSEIPEDDDNDLLKLQELSLEELSNLKIVTATKTRLRQREVPAATYIITDSQIRARGYRTLADALHDVPGFDFQHTYGIFPDLVHQRGVVGNNQHLLLYVDGILDNNISENAILGGSIRFPLYNVKRIEIISGPSSALYGANAFNGVINIITKDGNDDPGIEVQAFGGTWMDIRYIGGGGNVALRGNLKTEIADFNYSISGYYYYAKGPDFRNVKNLDITGRGYYWTRYFNNSWEDTYNVTARFKAGGLRLQTVNWQYLQGDGTFANGTQQIDTDKRWFRGSSWDFRNNSVSIGYLWEMHKYVKLDSEFTFRHTEILSSSHEQYPVTPGPAAVFDPVNITTLSGYSRPDYSYELRERLQITPSKKISATIGIEGMFQSMPKGYNDYRRFKSYNVAAYGQVIYSPVDILSLTAGYRYDYNTNYDHSHTPRISIVINPGDFTAKVLFSTGFRAPTAWELFNATAQRMPNPTLDPERLLAGEVVLGYKYSKYYMVTVAGYYNRISNLILEVKTGTLNQNQNVGNADVAGVEIQNEIRLFKRLSIFLNYTYSYGKYSNLPLTLTPPSTIKGSNIPNIAPHKFNAGLTVYIITGLSLHARVNYVHTRTTIFTNVRRTVSGYALVHGNLRWEISRVPGLFVQFTARNIVDTEAFDPGIRTATGEYYPTKHPVEGRNLWLTLGYKF